VLATACTAPVLGTAVGYAFAQPPLTIVLIFLTVGVGLAFPYVVLSWKPAWLKFLPKPGAWMEKFKVAMGFAMLAASVWLLSLVTIFYGERTWWLAMFLVVLALAAWVFGEFVQRGRKQRGVAFVTVAVLVGAGYLFTFERQFEWRAPITASAAAAAAGNSDQALPANLVPAGYNWEPWSLEAIDRARAAGQPVIVDFTARWCINCQINVKPTLASRAVREKLKELNAVALLADYTRRPDHMTEELLRHGRGGVPLVLVYPGDAQRPPIVLPEALTPGIVLGALERAVSKLN
jgi:thiol:disulfide interchange protein DsbD